MEPQQENQHKPFVSEPTFDPVKKLPKKALVWLAIAAVAVLIGGAAWVATSSDKTSQSAAKQAAGPSVAITMAGPNPASIKIKKGQEVTWVNQDSRTHRLSADQSALPGFDSIDTLATGDSYTFTFDTIGTFHYYDPADPKGFNGTVIVE